MDVFVMSYSALKPLTLVGQCAGTSTDKPLEELPEKSIARAKKCFADGHFSVFEHVTCTMRIDGISRACSHQLVRHRHLAITQESQRYVTQDFEVEYIYPEDFLPESDPKKNRIYREALERADEAYHELISLGAKAEDARYILPNAAPTSITVTFNMASFAHFYQVRTESHAQAEIRELARAMMRAMNDISNEWYQLMFLIDNRAVAMNNTHNGFSLN